MKNLLCLAVFLGAAGFAEAQITLDTFGNPGATGAVIASSSWNGNVSQTTTTMTVNAHDDNGWGTTSVNINASSMNYVNFTALRDASNAASTLTIQFEDASLNTKVYTVATSSFAVGSLTTVSVALTNFSNGFDTTSITGWNIGGGNNASNGPVFAMTFDNLSLSATPIPEPSTYAAIFGLSCLGLAVARKYKRGQVIAA
jgi:hypothetical protein